MSSHYSILVIPENHLESKRYHLPKVWVHLSLLSLALVVGFIAVMTWGFIHYRHLSKQVAGASSPGDDLYRAQVLTKMHQLEDSLQRTQQFASRMETMVGVETNKLKLGVGPYSEHEDFGKYLAKVSQLPRASDKDLFSQSSPSTENFYEKLNVKLEELSEYALNLETRVHEVYEIGHEKLSYWASTPSIWPVRGWVTSDFGARINPLSGASQFHQGLDIAAPYGADIYAPSDATISFAGYKGGYGNALVLDHGYGVSTLYAHTSNIFVKEGQKIKRGQLLAFVGSSGSATGPHLHYEVHVDGVPTDPMRFLLK